jgi:hypothetical protein
MVLATVALCGVVSETVPVKYQASAELTLMPPASSIDSGGNPYLALGGLKTVVDILVRAMTDDNTVRALLRVGVSNPYVVSPDLNSSGPLVLVTADGSTAKDALAAVRMIETRIPLTLLRLQQRINIPARNLITSATVRSGDKAVAVGSSKTEVLMGTAVAGLMFTLFATILLDAFVISRQRRNLVISRVLPAQQMAQ